MEFFDALNRVERAYSSLLVEKRRRYANTHADGNPARLAVDQRFTHGTQMFSTRKRVKRFLLLASIFLDGRSLRPALSNPRRRSLTALYAIAKTTKCCVSARARTADAGEDTKGNNDGRYEQNIARIEERASAPIIVATWGRAPRSIVDDDVAFFAGARRAITLRLVFDPASTNPAPRRPAAAHPRPRAARPPRDNDPRDPPGRIMLR